MLTETKSQRLTLALVGRTNVGKSTLLNRIAGQDVAIVSPIAGTTTDVVEKTMELSPFGPLLWLDTGGWNDPSALGAIRRERTSQALARADIIVGVLTAETKDLDLELVALAHENRKPLLIVVTQTDLFPPQADWLHQLEQLHAPILLCGAETNRETFLSSFKTVLLEILPKEFIVPPELLAGIVPKGGTVLQIIPIDSQAPKGRIILPQMNVLRNALDRDYFSVVVTENRIREAVERCHPDLVICDSQIVNRMIEEIPADLPATTYSILMARIKGDLRALAEGAAAIRRLRDGDVVLIGEACTHHAAEDDIGRVKIPRWIQQHTGKTLTFDIASGKDFPKDLSKYALIVHCGGCMINRAFMLWRMEQAHTAQVPITNYGVCISETQHVLERVLAPFGIVIGEAKPLT
ncbi:MAG: [FeFe] hydrogenase H-cluster maturation GTPase HydF [Kiritimatiellia bacterium]